MASATSLWRPPIAADDPPHENGKKAVKADVAPSLHCPANPYGGGKYTAKLHASQPDRFLKLSSGGALPSAVPLVGHQGQVSAQVRVQQAEPEL
jgi:hypothetical protein